MIQQLTAGFILLGLCVLVHVSVLSYIVEHYRDSLSDRQMTRPGGAFLFVRIAVWMVLSHLIQMSAFAVFYAWRGVMQDLETAFYFSGVTYTTVGYGDVLPPESWRLLAGIEGLTGILMCGLSTASFFAIVSKRLLNEKPSGKSPDG